MRSLRASCRGLAGSLRGQTAAPVPGAPGARLPLHQRVRDQVHALEHDAIVTALKDTMGNKAKAARLLEIDYKTFRIKLKALEAADRTVANPSDPASGARAAVPRHQPGALAPPAGT